MAVPSTITDLNVVASSNGPAGTESPNTLDDYIRAQGAILRKLYNDVTDGTVPAYNATRIGGTTPTSAGLALIDDADAAAQRTTLGLGSAALLTAGTSANNLVQLNSSAQLPALDGSLLTGINAGASCLGSFSNLQASANGLGANVSVSADEIMVKNASNQYATLRSVSLTINTAASGANGLDTGTLAVSTWYALWVIYNGTTTAGLISTSASAPTMPSGYTHKARVGWIRTDGTANKYPYGFKQYGRKIQFLVSSGSNLTSLPAIVVGATGNISTPTWTACAVRWNGSTGSYVPSTACSIDVTAMSNGSGCIIAPNASYGGVSSTTNPPPIGIGAVTAQITKVILLEGDSIYFAAAGGGGLFCNGWEDNL